MVTLEDKLDTFYKIVFKYEEEKCKEILEKLEEKNKKILSEKKQYLEEKKNEIIRKKVQLAEIKKNEIIGKARQDYKENMLSKRQEILDDLIVSLRDKAIKFTSSKEYKTYLINRINANIEKINDREIILSLRQIDKVNFEKDIVSIAKKKKVKVNLNTLNEDMIGGFIISDNNLTYNLDNSFKTIIEENKYIIGKTLFAATLEAGDMYE